MRRAWFVVKIVAEFVAALRQQPSAHYQSQRRPAKTATLQLLGYTWQLSQPTTTPFSDHIYHPKAEPNRL